MVPPIFLAEYESLGNIACDIEKANKVIRKKSGKDQN
jgi:hypothetical protein